MSKNQPKNNKILGACIGDCIHVAGLTKFFRIANQYGYETTFVGAAMPIQKIITEIQKSSAKIIALSYRLTPQVGVSLLKQLIQEVKKHNLTNRDYYLGCLPELEQHAVKFNFFKKIFTGGEALDELYSIFQVGIIKDDVLSYPTDLISRIRMKAPYPIFRAHFGLPSLDDTYKGIQEIAESKMLDVISIAPDQAAQEWFHHPDIIHRRPKGSGGVPIRKKEHLEQMYSQSRTGNYPLMRIYSGTQDLVKNAELFQSSIQNAWAAIPIFWYSKLDGRGPLPIQKAIQEHFLAIQWHANHNIPVEVNDPHQWGLRQATDQMVVADAYLSAKIAKELGVRYYIEQLMFNTPAGNTFSMDFARVLAMIDIIIPLVDENFEVFKETRTGLAYLSTDPTVAKGQLAVSSMMQLAVQPHIMHVVSYSEASHAAKAIDVIKSCKMVSNIIQDSLGNLPDYTLDQKIIQRKNELIHQAHILINAFEHLGNKMGVKNPYLSSECLSEAVRIGLFDAPQVKGFSGAKGKIHTEIVDGKCITIDSSGQEIDEIQRMAELGILDESVKKLVSLKPGVTK
ncbi:MAG: methionine synthase [Candidatus Lokiarchaeota archaeon]|nr:methionine synthase [Candidatus Lokiarchaeota archaeon]